MDKVNVSSGWQVTNSGGHYVLNGGARLEFLHITKEQQACIRKEDTSLTTSLDFLISK